LYGRSALGGVVSTYTNEPRLNEYSGFIMGEVGEAELENYQGSVNVPLGSKSALRAAGQYLTRGHGYYNPDGGGSRSKAGRIKLLYQPVEELQIILTGNYGDSKAQSGGTSATLDDPDTINYSGEVTPVQWGPLNSSAQGTLKANYNFPESSLTYIGSYRDDKVEATERTGYQRTQLQYETGETPGNKTHTEELRWASDQEGMWTWLLGGSYYNYDYGNTSDVWVVESYMDASRTELDPDPMTQNAYTHGGDRTGYIKQWGIFTEETFLLTEKLRMTAGLRYDETTVQGHEIATMNMNINEYGHEMRPEEYVYFEVEDTLDYEDITWKLRFEYDMTPDSMLYASASTGFLPGDVRVNTKFAFGPQGIEILFSPLPMEEEKVIAFEVGSKNQFFGNKLQVNGAVFYYDYKEYRNVANISPYQMPTWATLTTPLRMIGGEIGTVWMVTAQDKVSFDVGYLDAKITEFPIDPFYGDTHQYLVFDRIENNPEWLVNISYDHTFSFANGSALVPRITARWQSGMYLSNLTQQQYDIGYAPYVWQESYWVADLGITWTSSSGMYSASGYLRNFTDTEYKNGMGQLGTTNTLRTGVVVGDPQAWGVNLSVRF
jgi:outer membrane receptor protein involved in Fe transport